MRLGRQIRETCVGMFTGGQTRAIDTQERTKAGSHILSQTDSMQQADIQCEHAAGMRAKADRSVDEGTFFANCNSADNRRVAT